MIRSLRRTTFLSTFRRRTLANAALAGATATTLFLSSCQTSDTGDLEEVEFWAEPITAAPALSLGAVDLAGTSYLAHAAAVDLDGDDDADVLAVPRSGSMQVLRNQGGGIALVASAFNPALATDGGRIEVGDLDLDGDNDAVVIKAVLASTLTNRVVFNRWADLGRFRFDTSAALLSGTPLPSVTGTPVLLDWDRDGDLDLVVAGKTAAEWRFLKNRRKEIGKLEFVDASGMAPAAWLAATDAYATDLDGDGFTDLVATGASGTLVLQNQLGTSFVDASVTRGVASTPGTWIRAADFDRDGLTDVFLARSGAWKLLRNVGPGLLKDITAVLSPALPSPGGIAVGDLDLDGHPDLFVADRSMSGKHVLFTYKEKAADGTPMFDQRPVPTLPPFGVAPAVFTDSRGLTTTLVVASYGASAARAYVSQADDSDCDQIPSGFEKRHLFNALDPADREGNPEKDEVPSYLEYRFGRSPRQAVSYVDGLRDDRSLQAHLDLDGDGVRQDRDNCPNLANANQADADADKIGDLCDPTPLRGAIPLTQSLTEYKSVLRGHDHRYFADRSHLYAAIRKLGGYFNQRSELRLFSNAATGLNPLYEIESRSGGHRYLVGTSAWGYYKTLIAQGQAAGAPEIIGYVRSSTATSSFGIHLSMPKLRSFLHPTERHQILTINSTRASSLLAQGYTEEAFLGYVPANGGEYKRPKAVVSLKNPLANDRRYTLMSTAELGVDSYQSESAKFQLFLEPMPGTVPLYRLFHLNTRDLVLTIDAAERSSLISGGYRDEGVLGYVFSAAPSLQVEEVIALQRLRLPSGHRLYTTDRKELETLLANGVASEGIEGWVVRAKDAYRESCVTSAGVPTLGPAAGILRVLEGVADPVERETAAALSLNTLCSIRRVAEGNVQGDVEQRIFLYVNKLGPEVKARLLKAGQRLDAIPAVKRTELLGSLSYLDPGACTAAPDWTRIHRGVLFSHRAVPRLRDNFCSGNFTYADATSAERAITVGSEIVNSAVEIDSQVITETVASTARPVVLGIEGEHVDARHPALAATDTTPTGDGMNVYGVVTTIPCSSVDESGCNPSLGLLCGIHVNRGDRCVAYPVVTRDQELVLRGFNFWDVEEAQLLFTPVDPALSALAVPTSVIGVDANEPLDGNLACPLPTPANPTHNRAHFPVTANAGRFYKLTMFNHNGHFFTRQDTVDHADPRVLHACYPPSANLEEGIPAGTIRDCTEPTQTCAQDGAGCTATWTTPPRKLENCRHEIIQPAVCGETPEWFASVPLVERSDEFVFGREPIVFVENSEPSVRLTATLETLECIEESGWDWTGADEPMILLQGFPDVIQAGTDADFLDDIDDTDSAFHGSDFHSGTRCRLTTPKLLSSKDNVLATGEVLYLLLLAEDDSALTTFLVGAAIIVAAAATIYVAGWAGIWTAVVGTATAVTIWGVISAALGEDDPMGKATFSATPLQFSERIASTHAANFLSVVPALFGVLPKLLGGVSLAEAVSSLLHPFAEYRATDPQPAPQCNPGTCASGFSCVVQQCVPSGFVDPTVGVGFRERRRYTADGTDYAMDLRWEMRPSP